MDVTASTINAKATESKKASGPISKTLLRGTIPKIFMELKVMGQTKSSFSFRDKDQLRLATDGEEVVSSLCKTLLQLRP